MAYGYLLIGYNERNTLFEEAMRRLSALDWLTTPEERIKVMSRFNNAMRRSEYGPGVRQDILIGALKRDKELRAPGVSRNRDKAAILQGKENSKLRFKNTWFLKGNYTSVLKVQATTNGVLAAAIRRKVGGLTAPDGGGTMVIEAAGMPITAGMRTPVYIIQVVGGGVGG